MGVATSRLRARQDIQQRVAGQTKNGAITVPGKAISKRNKTAATGGTKGSRTALGDIGNARNVAGLSTKTDKEVAKEAIGEEKEAEEEPKEIAASLPPALPEGVTDIDAQDVENPQMCSEYAPEMYAYLRQLEKGLVIKKNFLMGCPVNGRMRGVLLDWLVEVGQQFKLLQETLYMTVFIVDCFLQAEGLLLKRNQLQLVGVTAMFLASKVEEMYPPEIYDFVYITDNAYNAGEIRIMELKILNTTGFNVTRPHPLHFLRRNSKAGDVDVLQHSLAKYIMEVAMLEYEMAHFPPSKIAAAALFLSLRLLEPEAKLSTVWTQALENYSTYKAKDLLGLVFKMAEVLANMEENKWQAVKTKYSMKKFLKVALMDELKGELLSKLAARDIAGL